MFDYTKLTEHFSDVLDNDSVAKPLKVGLVGAGGKTSTLFALVHFFKARGLRVLVSTTTKIYVPEPGQVDDLSLECNAHTLVIENGASLLIGQEISANEKIVGCPPGMLEAINPACYDVLLYEADGAKKRSIKAPSMHEPILVAGSSHIIGVVGLDVLGKRVNAQNVHRVHAFMKVTELELDVPITPQAVGKLVKHSAGLFKDAGSEAEKILLLTKMDTPSHRAYAEAIESILKPWNGIVFSI